MNTIALVFDFDDTLLPDSTTRLLASYGVDAEYFWQRYVKELIRKGFEPSLAYLNRILDLTGDGRPLGLLSPEKLNQFGSTLNKSFYPGLSSFFSDIKSIVNETAADEQLQVEFYIVSGGLQAVIEGTPLVKKYFHQVYGCQFGTDETTGAINQVARCVTFTEKTRYLFEINKGILPQATVENPYLVNKDITTERRRIPFKNMIYVGDGLTDIPCFSLVKRMGGMAFGVFNPQEERSARRALLEFLHTDRVVSMHAPRFRKTDELGSLLRAAVKNIAGRLIIEAREA